MSEAFTLILILGCLVSFLAGAGVTLTSRYMVEFIERKEQNTPEVTPVNEKLNEQWTNFLTYDGRARGDEM